MVNPLFKAMNDNNWSATEVAYKTALTAPTIRSISRMRPEEIGFLRLKTVVQLKKHAGVDLLEYLVTM